MHSRQYLANVRMATIKRQPGYPTSANAHLIVPPRVNPVSNHTPKGDHHAGDAEHNDIWGVKPPCHIPPEKSMRHACPHLILETRKQTPSLSDIFHSQTNEAEGRFSIQPSALSTALQAEYIRCNAGCAAHRPHHVICHARNCPLPAKFS